MDEAAKMRFKVGFCTRAAELGFTPSDLLMCKRAGDIPFFSPAAEVASKTFGAGEKAVSTGQGAVNLALTLAALGLVGGGVAGAGANWMYNKGVDVIDPEGQILPEFSEADEAKKLHLLAKYRQATNEVRKGLA
jgi:hypothetical protein